MVPCTGVSVPARKAGVPLPSKRRRLLGISLELLAFAVLVFGTALVARPLKSALDRRMEALRDRGLAILETALGRKVEYAYLGPSIFGFLDIRELRIIGADGEAVASAARLRVGYSLGDLLSGDPTGALRSLRFDGLRLSAKKGRDDDLLALFFRSAEGVEREGATAFSGYSLPRNLELRVRDGDLRYEDGSQNFTLSLSSLDADLREEVLSFSLSASLSYGGWADAPEGFHSAALSARLSGSYDIAAAGGKFLLSVSRLRSERLSLKALTLTASLDGTGIEVRKTKDRAPYDLILRYDAALGQWSGEFKAEGFVPSSIVSLEGPWVAYSPWMEPVFSGTAAGTYRPGTALSYSADLRVELPQSFPLGRGTGEAKFRGLGDRLSVEKLTYEGGMGSAAFSGELALRTLGVDGHLSLRDFKAPRAGVLRGEFDIASEGAEYIIFGEDVGVGEVSLSALDARLLPSADAVGFSLSALRFADLESYEDVRLTRIDAEGSFSYGDRLLQASISLEALSAADALAFARPFAAVPAGAPWMDEALEKVFITTELFLTTNFVNLSVNAPRLVAAYRGKTEYFLVASLSGTDRRVELQDGRMLWSAGSMDLSAYMDYSNTADLAFGLRALYQDIPYYFDGMYLDGRSFSLQGSYGLSVNFSRGMDGGISGFLVSEGLPVPTPGGRAFIGASASYRWNSPSSWSLSLDRLDLDNLYLPTSPSARLRMQGSATESGATLTRLSYDDGRGLLSGHASVTWSEGYRNPSMVLRLADQSGVERYEAEGELGEDGAELRLYVARAQVARFLKASHSAQATGELRLVLASADSFAADWRLSRLQARLGDTELVLAVSGSVAPRDLRLEDLRLSFGALQLEVPAASVDLDSSTATASGRLRGTALSRDTEMEMRASAVFAPMSSWGDVANALEAFSGTLQVSRLRLDDWLLAEPFEIRVSRDADFLSVSGGPRDALRLRRGADGAFYAALSNPSPIRGSLTGTLVDGILEAKTENLYLDMPALWSLLPENIRDEVSFTGGFAEASVRVSGPLGDPEFFGSAHGSGIRLRVPKWVGAEIEPSGVVMILEGNQMSFAPLPVRVGTGRATASGSFIFERWIPSTVNLDISIAPVQSIPFLTDIFGVRAAGSVYGVLNIAVDERGFGIRGRLFPHNTLITLDTRSMAAQQARSVAPGSSQGILVDLSLTAGRRVEFAWPGDEFPIVRGYADVGTGFTIQADGDADRFSMNGDVRLRGGEVFYFQRSFYIREGVLRFQENEVGFNPRVALRAELRDRTDEGPVTVALVVDEAPLTRFTPRLESDPPLSQYEIISLLGQNLSSLDPADGGDRFQDALLTASSDVLAQFNVIRVFERNVRDALGLDMFSVRTQVLQNAVLQATGLRSDPVDRIGGLGNYFDNTTVFFGKYLGSDLFLQSMLSLRYDEYKSYELFGGLTLEPDIGVEMKTPLFTLRWNFVPTVGNSEKLFIDDHSFTLSWKWSF